MALNLHSRPKSTEDYYGNQIEMQLPTPTTILLEKRNRKQESIGPQPQKYVLTRELLVPIDIQKTLDAHSIEKQICIFLKDQAPTKRFTIEIKITEVEK
jgi:hypothetical protein